MDSYELKKLIRNPKLVSTLMPSIEQAFDKCMNTLGLTYNYKTDSVTLGGKIITDALALSKIKVHLQGREPKEFATLAKDLLPIWKYKNETDFLDAIARKVHHQKQNKNLVAQWVEAVTGQASSLDVAVMTHFIWQVKRKMNGLPVEQHVMPVLFGTSGGGKSVAVSKLLSTISNVVVSADMGIFDDAFSKRTLSRNFVVFIDELQGAEEVNINSMKQIITTDSIDWRVMRSEHINSAPQNATFIGCTNEPVKDRICDPTTSRRFWELRCLPQLNWDLINAIDYLSLWRSVDENAECPIKKLIPEIRAVQNAHIKSEKGVDDATDQSTNRPHLSVVA